MAELIKLAGMAGAMHQTDHTYSVRSTLITLISYRRTVHSLCCLFAIFCFCLFPYNMVLSIFFYFFWLVEIWVYKGTIHPV